MKSSATCDKCGESVERKEDVTWLEAIAKNTPAILMYHARHINCSPSRAQYIMHDDFDPYGYDYRAEYDKRRKSKETVERLEKMWTDAWVRLQETEEIVWD